MSQTTAPLQLDAYFFDSLSVKTNPKGDPGYRLSEDELVIKVRYGMRKDDPTKHKVEMTVRNDPKNPKATYWFSIIVLGFFTVPESPEAQTLIVVTGSSMIFGVIREILLNITSRGPHPHLMLPTISSKVFVDIFSQEKGTKKKEQ